MKGSVWLGNRAVPTGQSNWTLRDALMIFGAFLILYLPFSSIDFEPNGVIEAGNLESASFLSRNHIIYRVVGSGIYHVARSAGYSGRSIYLLQKLNAVCGAAGVALAFIAFLELGASRRSAFAAALLWGTSFIYWFYSTDVAYVVMASAFAAAALVSACLLKKKASTVQALLLGLFLALSTLTFQMAGFLIPVLLWAVRRRFREMAIALSAAAVIVGGGYLALGISEGHYTPIDLLNWATTYAGGHLSSWGRFDAGRIPAAANAAARSFQFDVFVRTGELLANPYHKYMWRLAFGAACFFLLAGATIVAAVMQVFRGNSRFLWLIASYLLFWPFIVWFDPSDPFWFLLPNLFLCAAAALVWKTHIQSPIGYAVIFGTIGVMAAFTFSTWVWPKHIDAGSIGRKVDCIAQNVRQNDLVIAPDWIWPASLSYFHNIQALQIIDHALAFNDHGKLIAFMANESNNAMQKGGRVLIVDPKSYTPEYLDWLFHQTSFTTSDFEKFPGKVIFQCEDSKFRSVAKVDKFASLER